MKREREITRAFMAGLSMGDCAWVFGIKLGTVEKVVRKKPKRGYWRAGKR